MTSFNSMSERAGRIRELYAQAETQRHGRAWTREEGEPAYIAEAIADWMRSGALPGDPHSKPDVIRIYDAVQSRLRDLYAMPPAPVGIAVKHGAVPIGVMEVVERGTGQTINQVELVSRNVRPS